MDNNLQLSGPNVKIKPPLVFFGTVILSLILHFFIKLELFVTNHYRIILGIFIISVSGIIQLNSLKIFKLNGRKPNPKLESKNLFISGPYRFTRNPMYLSLVLLQFGIGIIFNNIWMSLFSFMALVFVHFYAVLPEEKYLRNKFGEEYIKYTEKVRRYI